MTWIGPTRGVGHEAVLLGHAEKRGAGSDLRDDWATAWLAGASAGAAHSGKGGRAGRSGPAGRKREAGLRAQQGKEKIFIFYFIFKTNSNVNQIKFE